MQYLQNHHFTTYTELVGVGMAKKITLNRELISYVALGMDTPMINETSLMQNVGTCAYKLHIFSYLTFLT